MQMRMMEQILTPGMENREETDFGAQMLGIGSNGLEGLGSGPKENAIDGPLVLQGNSGNLFRYSKDDVKILGFQNLGLAVFDPLGAGQRLAFGTMTIRTRVEPNTLLAAPVTHFDVTAESGRAARFNRGHDAALCRGQQCAELLTIGCAVEAKYVRHFRPRTIHRI